jgi:hypothetical protein
MCHNFRITYSSICIVCDVADRIKESTKSGIKWALNTFYSGSSTMECMEKCLVLGWRIMPESMLLIQAMGHSVYEDFPKGDDNVKPFSASTGWCSCFTKRYNLHNIEVQGEAASADTVAVMHYVGSGRQSLNPPEIPRLNGNFVLDFHEFDFCDVFPECYPGVKQDLPLLYDCKSAVWIFFVKLTDTFSKSVYK